MLSQGTNVGGLNTDVRNSLLQAEEALRTYAKQWEAKQQSMRTVKSKLRNKRWAAYGAGDLEESELQRTPCLTSLSNDPMLNLAVRVYLPAGGSIRIGRPVTEVSEDGEERALKPSDLQLEGLGIEERHCVISHNASEWGEAPVILTNDSMTSMTYINGKQIPQGDLSGVELADGDRIVLGLCSHIFYFSDPRHDQLSAPPTHQQALREVLLGRAETESERKERLAMMVWNLWKMPFYRHVFEERLVDSLKAVREASTLSHALCPTSGIFFETTLSSTVDLAALHSLRVTDLFAYSNIMIRIRCCSVLSPFDLASTADSGADEMDVRENATSRLSHAERLARCSRASSIGIDTLIPVAASRQRSSFTSHLQRQWRTADAILLFESNLGDFLQGMEVLKDLYASTLPLREVMDKLRKYPRPLGDNTIEPSDTGGDSALPTSLSVLCGAAVEIVEAITGCRGSMGDVLQDLLSRGDGEEALPRAIAFVAEAVTHVGLDDALLREMFHHFMTSSRAMEEERSITSAGSRMAKYRAFTQSTELAEALLDALHACLHDSVVGCFDSPDVLTANGNGSGSTPVLTAPAECSVGISPTAGGQFGPDSNLLRTAKDILDKVATLRSKSVAVVSDSFDYYSRSRATTDAGEYDNAIVEDNQSSEANDWVRCYDDASGNYYLYSESLQISRWV